jgi:hypothetical protein
MDELNPLDLVEAYEGRAGLLVRCILFGLVEPDVEITPAVQATLAQAMVDELVETLAENRGMFPSRARRAYAWAVRADVSPEFAIFMGEQVRARVRAENRDTREDLFESPEYRAYCMKFADVIGALLGN